MPLIKWFAIADDQSQISWTQSKSINQRFSHLWRVTQSEKQDTLTTIGMATTTSLVLLLLHFALQAFVLAESMKAPRTSHGQYNGETILAMRADAPVRHLARAAPYAIESGSNMRNIVFRLASANRSSTTKDTNEQSPTTTATSNEVDSDDPWTFVTKNGTLVGSKANLNLKKLLETLEVNNFTSEVKFDEQDTNLVNITISNLGSEANKFDTLLLEELLVDANLSTIKDNNPQRVVEQSLHSAPSNRHRSKPHILLEQNIITSPPIRSVQEVVAENYTVKKISEEANIFACKLLHQLNIEKLGSRNLIQSPFSVYQGLTLLLTGAMGETAKELDKALLGSQSSYENTKLTHDQDRPRLLASLSEVVRQLHHSATHHLKSTRTNDSEVSSPSSNKVTGNTYSGGTSDQHLVMANNLLFSPSAFEISYEFKNTVQNYFANTALTKMEIGSTESVQVVNGWIRSATNGVIPAILNRKNTFDEFNVMALLCTSWLAQEWADPFYRIGSPLRNSIRLKGQGRALGSSKGWNLLEFIDDNKQSHFVDYIKSRPSQNIRHYHSTLNGLVVDVVVVPFKDSNHRLIALTPLSSSSTYGSSQNATHQQLLTDVSATSHPQAVAQLLMQSQASQSSPTSQSGNPASAITDAPDQSLLTKLISSFATQPRKLMRNLWNIVAPEIITKQTLQNIQAAKQKNVTSGDDVERTVEANLPAMVQLSMPVIRSQADSSISAALNHIGIVNTFDPDQANFIGINGHPFNYYKLHLSNVLSKTILNLNERGINYDTTIKTLESLRILPQKKDHFKQKLDNDEPQLELVDEVKLNKPFMYFICDIKTRLVLYTGVLRNPEQEGP